MKFILSLILLIGGLHAFTQQNEMGEIRFLVEVDNGYFEIEINDTMLLKRYKDSLPAGNYTARIWSPGYEVNELEFSVYAGKMVEKRVPMTRTADFLSYKADYKAYRMQFHKQLTAPVSFSLASSIVTGVFMINAYTTKNAIFSDIDLYGKSPVTSEIDVIKQRVADNTKKYNRQRTGFYISSGITALLVGATTWSYINFKRNYTEPTYNKESPFAEKFSMSFTPYGCSLTFKI